MSKKSHHFLMLWPWPLTYDLEKLIRSGHYHYQCVSQIWQQSIPWFLSYRVNTIAGGGRLRRKTITSPDPSDTGDINMRCIFTHSFPKHQWKTWLKLHDSSKLKQQHFFSKNMAAECWWSIHKSVLSFFIYRWQFLDCVCFVLRWSLKFWHVCITSQGILWDVITYPCPNPI